MKMADREPGIIKEFRELYEYVRLMGEHINQIHSRLDKIERDMNEVSSSHRNAITENAVELKNVKERMINKYELDDFVEKLKASVGEELPSLPLLANKPPQVDEVTEDVTEE
jgi:DNA anti-recombination protein RmuC